MTKAFLVNVDRNAAAELYVNEGMAFGCVPYIPIGTAEEACAAAIKARDSGMCTLVRVWVKGRGHIDFFQIGELHQHWAANPG